MSSRLSEHQRVSNRNAKECGLPAKLEDMKITIMKPNELGNTRTLEKASEVGFTDTQVQRIP